MDQAPAVSVRGSRSRKAGEPKRAKPKMSAFFITLSTNQRYRDDADPNKESDEIVLEEITSELLNNIGNYIRFTDQSHAWKKEHIDDVDAEFATEFGSKTKALHVHIFVKIKHRSHIRLDYQAVKQYFLDKLGLKNLFFSSKLIRGSPEHFIQRYVSKGQHETD